MLLLAVIKHADKTVAILVSLDIYFPNHNSIFGYKELPIFTEKGVWMRLIAGDAYGLRNEH
jgi:hypothetical protein